MSSQWQRANTDLRRADRWDTLDPCQRAVESLDHYDEFGYFWHRISDLVARYGEIGPVSPMTNEDLVTAMVTVIEHGGVIHEQLQGLPGRGRDDRPSGTASRTTVRNAPPAGRQSKARKQPQQAGAGGVRAR